MDMNERQANILRMIIGDYIKSAKPIGSAKLVRRHKMGCCSATVRNDMSVLEDLGFITQSHFSAGRMPTVRGYRYFIDRLMSDRETPARFRRRILLAIKSMDSSKYSQAVKILAEEVANMTNNLTVVTLPSDRIQMSGLRYMFNHPEFRSEILIGQVGVMLDRLDQILFDLKQQIDDESFHVYLGNDLEYDFVKGIAVAVKKFRDPFGEEHIFSAIGPIRMDYSVLPGLMEFAVGVLEDF